MNQKSFVFSRRKFLKLCGIVGGGLFISGTADIGLKAAKTIQEQSDEIRIIPTVGRNNCGGRCVIKAHVKDGTIIRLSTDDEVDTKQCPQIRACLRGRGYRKTFLSPDRLKYPMKRVGERGMGEFERISWEEAIETIAKETKRIKEQYGVSARYVNYASGNQGIFRGDALMRRLLALDGGFLDFYGSYSTICTEIATPYTYGTSNTGNSPESFMFSKLIFLWSFNPAETIHGSLTTYHLKKAKENGAKIIVVDPRCSDTVTALADEWIAIKPTTDAAMLAAMSYVIVTLGFHDQKFLDMYCQGFDAAHMPEGFENEETVKDYILGIKDGIPKTPEWAEKICGVPANKIKQLAIEYATAKPAAMIQGWGMQRQANAEQAVRFGTVLPALTGNIGIIGGWACGHGKYSRIKTLSLSMPKNPYQGKISCFLWTDAVVRGKEMTAKADGVKGVNKLDTNIKLIYNIGGNTLINQHSDCNKTAQILKDTSNCEFIVCADLFMTASAKFADILLPATSMFEGENIVTCGNWSEYITYCNKAIDPMFECRDDHDWILDVAEKLGLAEKFSEGHRTVGEWCESTYNLARKQDIQLPSFEEFKKRGIFKWNVKEPYIAFKKQIEDPINNPFPTPSGKIELFSPALHKINNPEEIPPIPKYVPAFEGPEDPLIKKYPLQCMGWHYKRRAHSMHDNNPWMEEAGPQVMWINPEDAKTRKIQDGDKVEVFNDRGRVHICVKVTSRIIPGVIAIPQGGWYTPNKEGIDIRGNINTLTTQRPTPLAKGNPQHTNLVEVKALLRGEI